MHVLASNGKKENTMKKLSSNTETKYDWQSESCCFFENKMSLKLIRFLPRNWLNAFKQTKLINHLNCGYLKSRKDQKFTETCHKTCHWHVSK